MYHGNQIGEYVLSDSFLIVFAEREIIIIILLSFMNQIYTWPVLEIMEIMGE